MKLPQPCPRCGTSIYNYTMRCGECCYGTPVMVFDPRLFKNDRDTPLAVTVRRAVVVDSRTDDLGRWLYDVRFDHRPGEVSRGHFAHSVRYVS